jgi:small-conductance mechanosensitive channel
MQQIFIRIAKIAIFILSFMVTMPLIGIDVTALSVFGGALGVGLGFGLQKIASNFLSGFIILLDRSIKVGDRLIIDNNGGIVTKITTRYVVMARFDGTETLIPNETFITSSIQNQSYSSTSLRFEAVFSVSDSSDITLALKLIGQAVQSAPNAIADKAYASISRLIDNGIEIKGYFWLPDPKHFTEANNYIYIKVLQDFKQNNIATPAPSTQNIKMLN